jgi:hypothetical protein
MLTVTFILINLIVALINLDVDGAVIQILVFQEIQMDH